MRTAQKILYGKILKAGTVIAKDICVDFRTDGSAMSNGSCRSVGLPYELWTSATDYEFYSNCGKRFQANGCGNVLGLSFRGPTQEVFGLSFCSTSSESN